MQMRTPERSLHPEQRMPALLMSRGAAHQQWHRRCVLPKPIHCVRRCLCIDNH